MKILRTLMVAVAVIGIQAAQADTTGYIEGGTETNSGGGYGGGAFNFTVTTAIQVTQLGFFALSIGGGDTPHVYLWDVTTNTMLADSGNLQGTLTNGQWNYTTLATPVSLAPGDTYQVSAPCYFTPTYPDTTAFTFGPQITSGGFYNKGSGFGGWTQSAPYATAVATNVPTDANFRYVVSAVPEPSTVGLLVFGGISALGLTLRRRSR